jgi:predicted transcriptional regulator
MTDKPDGASDLLGQPVRRRLWDIIRLKPGIHASQLCRESGEAWGTVQYHLSLLSKGDLVTSQEAGRERRFFQTGIDEKRAHVVSLVRQGRRPEIAQAILASPGLRQIDLCDSVKVSRKTFRSSVQPLVDAGLIRERKGLQTNRYFPEDGLESLVSDSAGASAFEPSARVDIDVA